MACFRELLKMSVSTRVSWCVHSLSTLHAMLSGAAALLVFMFFSVLQTFSVLSFSGCSSDGGGFPSQLGSCFEHQTCHNIG